MAKALNYRRFVEDLQAFRRDCERVALRCEFQLLNSNQSREASRSFMRRKKLATKRIKHIDAILKTLDGFK